MLKSLVVLSAETIRSANEWEDLEPYSKLEKRPSFSNRSKSQLLLQISKIFY